MKIKALVLLLLFFFVACESAASTAPALAPNIPSVPTFTQILRPTQTQRPAITRTSTTTTLLTPIVTQTPIYPIFSPKEYLPGEGLITQAELHNLILYIVSGYGVGNVPIYWLYALTPDGSYFYPLSSYDTTFSVFRLSDQTLPLKVAFSEFDLSNSGYEIVELPPECDVTSNQVEPCEVQFSPDGLYLGIRYGPERCGRNMMIINAQTGQVIYRLDNNKGHWIDFTGYGKVLAAQGHCQGGELSLIDLQTGVVGSLGIEGSLIYNQDHSALFIYYYGGFTVYDILKDKVFLPKVTRWTAIDNAQWTADGQHIIHQYRDYTFNDNNEVVYDLPARIMLMDTSNGREQFLASNPNYHFILCDSEQVCPYDREAHDRREGSDWFSIKRVAFKDCPGSLMPLPYIEDGIDTNESCVQAIRSAELLALNWRTGQIIPWDENRLPTLPTPTATSLPSGPDLSVKPIYQDPSGNYAFYTGPNGVGLWMVPRTGQPVQWVVDGWGFMYIP